MPISAMRRRMPLARTSRRVGSALGACAAARPTLSSVSKNMKVASRVLKGLDKRSRIGIRGLVITMKNAALPRRMRRDGVGSEHSATHRAVATNEVRPRDALACRSRSNGREALVAPGARLTQPEHAVLVRHSFTSVAQVAFTEEPPLLVC